MLKFLASQRLSPFIGGRASFRLAHWLLPYFLYLRNWSGAGLRCLLIGHFGLMVVSSVMWWPFFCLYIFVANLSYRRYCVIRFPCVALLPHRLNIMISKSIPCCDKKSIAGESDLNRSMRNIDECIEHHFSSFLCNLQFDVSNFNETKTKRNNEISTSLQHGVLHDIVLSLIL